MFVGKKTIALALAAALSLLLTACDPPMPEDLKIALAEKTVICEPGVAELVLPESLVDLGYGWADSMAIGCTYMQLAVTDSLSESSGLVVAPANSKFSGESFLKVPFALDAAVLVVNLADVFEIYLSAQTIAAIFSGKITNWNDSAIAADNLGFELPDQNIILPTEARVSAKSSLTSWIESITGESLDLSKVSDSNLPETVLASPTELGSISIASYSAALLNGSVFAAVLTEAGNVDSAVLASTETIYAASTQLIAESSNGTISLKLDAQLEPTAPEGSIAVALPYQAIFPVELNFLGTESALVRTAGRFLLRQESQGVIASSTMLPIPESIRILAVKLIEEGLSIPKG